MASIYDDMNSALQNFLSSVDKELDDIRKCKAEIQQLKLDIVDRLNSGQYIRDDKRIVISAPEIIIGDVCKDGTLRNQGHSTVIIRSNAISQEAPDGTMGITGTITSRATRIYNTCADPGVAGNEEVVGNASQFIVQAQGIALRSEDTKGAFATAPGASPGAISLQADTHIGLNATAPRKTAKERIEKLVEATEKEKDDLNKTANDQISSLKEMAERLAELIKASDSLYDKDDTLRTEYLTAEEINEELKDARIVFGKAFSEAFRAISQLAEISRKVKCLKEKKDDIASKESDDTTGTSVDIVAEHTGIRSIDAEGKVFNNDSAGVVIQGKGINICASDETGATMADSAFDLKAANISLATISPKYEEKSADMPATGDVRITSKNIVMESVDYEVKDDKRQEKALTDGGSIQMRAETIGLCTNDTEGAGKGKVSVNSKAIALKAMDLDKESRADKELTKDSTLALLADKIYAGSPTKDKPTQTVQILSDKVGIFAKTTAELQQDDAKAALQLDGGNIALTGSKTTLFGETTVNGKTAFKADITAGKATVDNIEIKSSFKSPCTSEGIAVPASPSTDKLSAKLQAEEAPKDEGGKK